MRRAVVTTAATLAVVASAVAAPAGAEDVPDYEPTPESLNQHDAPEWFEDAKLGYFIHWGPYSVPAYAPPSGGNAYAEWYWTELNNDGSPTQQRHAELYGQDAPYDAFIDDFDAERFDPTAWLDLFVEGGAKYFVFVSKHHDGVALWDTDTTDRDTVALGPRRDFAAELFEAAEDYPLKTGFYFSMPEWYHPVGGWFANGPTNPYTGAPVPYTGYTPVDDYVMDHQYPQMLELVDRFDPDIMWCDIGGPNNSNEFMAYYFNQAKNRDEPKEVTVNNRCGNGVHDFTTPEYAVEPDINPDKWEATRGIGRSFGFNAEEGPEDHLSPDELIDSFADIVSKNGNLLLNMGPRADGTIPEVQAERVRALGDWLEINGEAIYGTTYWNHADDENSNVPVRYTMNGGTLYATALEWPGAELTLSGDLPVVDASTITLLGADGDALAWERTGDGVTVTMPDEGAAATASEHAYTFKIETRGVQTLLRTDLAVADATELGAPVSASVTLTNPSDETAVGGRVTLDVPEGWTVTPRQAVVPRLAAGESRTVELQVVPAADAEPGRYDVGAQVRSGRLTYELDASVLTGFEEIAQGKPVAQKSLYQGNQGQPERAVDGNTDGSWGNNSVTHTAEPETEAWWQADLGASRQLGEIALWNRTDCCSDRLSDYYVFVSEQPFAHDSVAETLAQPGVQAFHQEAAAGRPTRLPVDVTGRYVRVQLTSGSNPLSLAEVQVFGRPPS